MSQHHATDRLPGSLRPIRRAGEDEALFEIENLSMYYGDNPAFREVTLPILRNRITAVVGPSGCGKTSFLTALNRLSDLVPEARVMGRLTIRDEDVLGPDLDVVAHRRRVGMIFQKPNPFPLSIRRNIELPLKEHGVRRRADLQAVTKKVLIDVGLWDEVHDRLDTPALELSGGQQQRLCIARALALAPEAVLMDEPTSSLDPLSGGVIEDLITTMEGNFTVVVVTHNLAQARRIADYVAVFWLADGAGRLIEHGPADEVFTKPRHPLTAEYLSGARG